MLHPYPGFAAIAFSAMIFVSSLAFAGEKPANEAKAPSAAADVDPLIATVNGDEIRLSAVEEARTLLPQSFKDIPENAIFNLLMNSLIDTNLMAGEARRLNLHEENNFKRQIKRITEQLLERALLAKQLEQKLTGDAIKNRYQKYVEEIAGKTEVHARQIVADNETKAKEAIAKLKKGEDFIKLVKEFSSGPAAANDGDLGFLTKEQMPPEFAATSFDLAKGEFTKEPIKTRFGWHVIKVEERRVKETPTFEAAKNNISALLSNEIASAYLKDLRNKAAIKLNPPPSMNKDSGAAKDNGAGKDNGAIKK